MLTRPFVSRPRRDQDLKLQEALTACNEVMVEQGDVAMSMEQDDNVVDKMEQSDEVVEPPKKPSFAGVTLIANKKLKAINRKQFLQSLLDRINERLSSTANETNKRVISDLEILDSGKWPSVPSIRYGEKQILRLCEQFSFNSEKSQQAVNGMRDFVDSGTGAGVSETPADLKPLLTCVHTLPVSTAECVRSFSLMNTICNDKRNSLLVKNVASLMMVSLNGPPTSLWKPEKYVMSWLNTIARQMPHDRVACCQK